MKVLVLGATGLIGKPVAQAFSREGHTVYGQTRSESKAKELAADEIIPIVCEPTDTNSWIHLVASIDVLIETLNGDLNGSSALILNAVSTAARTLRPKNAIKLTYIYASGTWVHGDNRSETVSDTTPVTNPVEIVGWRVGREQEVISSTILNGVVIRAGLVYGGPEGILGPMFKAAREGKVAWYGKPGGKHASIHQDDLASLFYKAAERASIAGGKIFDAVNDYSESGDALLEKLARITGVKGYSWIEPSNGFEEALASTALIRPYLGRSLLEWEPRKPSVVDGLETYYAAWEALQPPLPSKTRTFTLSIPSQLTSSRIAVLATVLVALLGYLLQAMLFL